MIRVVKNRVRWELHPDFAPFLDEVLANEKSLFKESSAKLVAVHAASGKEFFVKRYRHASVPLRPLKFFFKPSQARQEWRLALKLEQLGVPVVKHVALGERWSARGLLESILITESFPGKPLNELTAIDFHRLLKFVENLHESGVLQRDLHPGNILAAADGAEFRLVDLHGIEIKPALTVEERNQNLAYLRIFLPLPVASEVQALSARLRKRIFEKRSHRALKENREFSRERFGDLWWRVRLPLCNREAENILVAPDNFLASNANILKAGSSSTVGSGHGFVLKRFNLRKPVSLLKDLFRRSRAERAFRKAYHLELVGIPTARPVAAADRRIMRFLARSYFLMEEIPGATPSIHWRGKKSQGVSKAAKLVARLHDEGFTHRDLKLSNLLFDKQGRLFLIDLEGLEFPGDVSSEEAAADLRRMARAAGYLKDFSQGDRLRFLHRYCRQRKIPLREMLRLSVGSQVF